MITCGGCGREIELEGVETGSRFLCARCLHLEVAGPMPRRSLGHKAFLAVAIALLSMVFAAGTALCALYLIGTGDFAWFAALLTLMVGAMASAAWALARKRNLSLFEASLYLPLGLWVFVRFSAPGTSADYNGSLVIGGMVLLIAGAFSFYLYRRDSRRLPRL